MKNLPSILSTCALALGALATPACEFSDAPSGRHNYGQYGRNPADDHSRYAQEGVHGEGEYDRRDAYDQPSAYDRRSGYDRRNGYDGRDGYDQDQPPRTAIVIPVPGD